MDANQSDIPHMSLLSTARKLRPFPTQNENADLHEIPRWGLCSWCELRLFPTRSANADLMKFLNLLPLIPQPPQYVVRRPYVRNL